jgi:hypothetical protein
MSFRNLFSSMLDSRELQGLDMLSRQLAMAKAEQAFIDELNNIEKWVPALQPSLGFDCFGRDGRVESSFALQSTRAPGLTLCTSI